MALSKKKLTYFDEYFRAIIAWRGQEILIVFGVQGGLGQQFTVKLLQAAQISASHVFGVFLNQVLGSVRHPRSALAEPESSEEVHCCLATTI